MFVIDDGLASPGSLTYCSWAAWMNGPQVTAVAGSIVSVAMPAAFPSDQLLGKPTGRGATGGGASAGGEPGRPSGRGAGPPHAGYDPGIVRSGGLLVAITALTVLCVAACSPGRAVLGPASQPRPTAATTAPGTTPAEPPVQPAFRAS